MASKRLAGQDNKLRAKAASKNYSWVFKYKDGENWKQKSLNTGIQVIGGSRKEAKRIGEEMEREFLENLKKISVDTNRENHSQMTIREYAEYWLEQMKGTIKPNTHKAYADNVRKHIIPLLGDIKLCDLNQFHLAEFINKEIEQCEEMQKVIDKRLANDPDAKIQTFERPFFNSIKKHLATAGMMLEYAVSDGDVEENVVKKVNKQQLKKIPTSSFEAEPFDYKEVMALRECVKGTDLETPIMLATYLGLRREEVLGLCWGDINLEKKFIVIQNTVVLEGTKVVFRNNTTKTKKSKRVLPIVDGLEKYLLELKEKQERDKKDFGREYIKNDFVCKRCDGEPLKPGWISEAYRNMLKNNGFRLTRFHDLRHSCGTIIYEETGDIYLVSQILGHSDIGTTTKHYINTKVEDLITGMQKMDAIAPTGTDN